LLNDKSRILSLLLSGIELKNEFKLLELIEHRDKIRVCRLNKIGNSLNKFVSELSPLSSIEFRERLIDLKLVKLLVGFPLIDETIREYCLNDLDAWNELRIF